LFIPPPVWLVVLNCVGRYQNRAKESKAEKISHFRTTGEMVQKSEPSEKTIKKIGDIANVSHDTIAKVATPKPPLKRTKTPVFKNVLFTDFLWTPAKKNVCFLCFVFCFVAFDPLFVAFYPFFVAFLSQTNRLKY
jgi:hypothetical protein